MSLFTDTDRIKSTAASKGEAHDDPRGEFPTPTYWNSSNINYAAAGNKRNDLAIAARDKDTPIDLSDAVSSHYYKNRVDQTPSGHVIETDDTEGNERILIKHNSGTGVELRNDGSILMSSTKNRVELTAEDHTLIVEGDGKLVYHGNLSLKVNGDYTVDCLNYVVHARGNKTETIEGSDRRTVTGNVGSTIAGSMETHVGKGVTNTFLSGVNTNVKGDYNVKVQGAIGQVSSGDFLLTSESAITASTPDMNLAAESMSVFGNSGTIGGENIIMYNYNMFTGHSIEAGDTIATQTANIANTINTDKVTAASFHGDLFGTATNALSSNVSAGVGSGGHTQSASTAVDVANDNTETALPTPALISTYLTKSSNGIRKVLVDVGDYIKNQIDRSTEFSGITSSKPTVEKARSRMRDSANRANSAFVGSLISNSVVCESYNKPTPTEIGRVLAKDGTGVTSEGFINGPNPSVAFIPKRSGTFSIIPEFQYNPYFAKAINGRTKLAPGITLSKFLGSDDPTNMNFVRDLAMRTEIAKYLYLHAQIIRTINADNAEKFKDVTCEVAEGVYQPGPSETVTPGEINDLKMKGRAVVYKIIDKSGQVNNTRTFDVAAYWKDAIRYDKIILSYDTIDCNGSVDVRIIVVLPEVDTNWEATYAQQIETEFNNNKLSSNEFIEVLAEKRASAGAGGDVAASPPVTYTGENGKLAPDQLGDVGNGKQLRADAAAAFLRMQAAAAADGVNIQVSSGYRSYTHQNNLFQNALRKYGSRAAARKWVAPPGSSNHGWGIAFDEGTIYGGKERTRQYRWLNANAAKYGFWQRMSWEPWHWEYKGSE